MSRCFCEIGLSLHKLCQFLRGGVTFLPKSMVHFYPRVPTAHPFGIYDSTVPLPSSGKLHAGFVVTVSRKVVRQTVFHLSAY